MADPGGCNGVVIGEEITGGIAGSKEPGDGFTFRIENLQFGVNAQPIHGNQQTRTGNTGAKRRFDDRSEFYRIFTEILIHTLLDQLVVTFNGDRCPAESSFYRPDLQSYRLRR